MIANPHLPSADKEHALFAKLKQILAGYGVRDFAIFSIDSGEARLVFSTGGIVTQALSDRRLLLHETPALDRLVAGDVAFITTASPGPVGAWLMEKGAAAAFRLAFSGETLGVAILGSPSPAGALPAQTIEELTNLFALFSARFAQSRSVDTLNRDYWHSASKLRELQRGLDLLALPDREAILHMILSRALEILGSRAGTIWFCRDGGWTSDQTLGTAPADAFEELERLLRHCHEIGKPGLVSSLTGEESWAFDVETIHIAKTVVFPLRTRTQALGCIVAFDATVSLDVIDVVEGLALIGATALESWQNARNMLEQQRLSEQMSLAVKIQQRLLPSGRLKPQGLSVAYFSKYCDEAGGDYVDIIGTAEPYLCAAAVGDVSGHGLGAAMLMVDLRARLRTHIESRPLWSPQEVLIFLNDATYRESAPEEFVTLFLCAVDTRTGLLRYASAGHEPPLLFSAATGKWRALASTGLPLGMEAGVQYTGESLMLEPGDILVCPTDGATEAYDAAGETFGSHAITQAVEEHRERDAQQILDALVARTLDHARGVPFADDVTYLILKLEHVTLQVRDGLPAPHAPRIFSTRFGGSRACKDGQLAGLRAAVEKSCPAPHASSVLMSVDEALTNAVVHGCFDNADCPVECTIWGDGEGLTIEVSHEGFPFDVRRAVPLQLDGRALQRESGRGILIMTSLMDDVIYAGDGRSVRLCKRF